MTQQEGAQIHGMALAEELEPFAAAARTYVTRAVGLALDGSETSLAFVDHYVTRTSADGPIADDVLALVAPALGAYFGQLLVTHFGGQWVGELAVPASWRIELEPVPLSFSPVAMAASALRRGDVIGYDDTLRTNLDLSGALEAALAEASPVDEGYYYSLTGRFEVITQVVDVLVEVERRRREQAAGPTPPSEDEAGDAPN